MALSCGLLGSLQAARAALQLKPAEAMRPKPPVQGGAIWLERWGGVWRRLSFGWRLVLRNVFRNRVPVVTFSVDQYWDEHFRNRRWYGNKADWVGWGTPGWTPPPRPPSPRPR